MSPVSLRCSIGCSAELGRLFPGRDVNEIEVEIVNELKRKVKGYDRTESIREWLEDLYFTYHASMYKNRPSFWHISSKQGKRAGGIFRTCPLSPV